MDFCHSILKNKYFLLTSILFLYGIFTFFCYHSILFVNFLSDDYKFLYGCQTKGIQQIFSNFNDPYFRPVTNFINLFLYLIFGINSFGYHLFGLIIHTLNAFLLFIVIRQISTKLFRLHETIENNLMFFFMGLLFLINPYNTEAVVWFSANSFMFAVSFFLLFVFFYIKHCIQPHNRYLFLSGLFLFLSILSKEITLVAIIMVIFAELFTITNSNRQQKFWRIIIFSMITLIYIVFRILILGELIGGYGNSVHLNFSFALILKTILCYLAKFFLYYRYIPIEIKLFFKFLLRFYYIFIPVFIIMAMIFLQLTLKKNRIGVINNLSSLSFIMLFFFISLLPVINLETSFLGNIQSDRYGYFAGIFFSIFLGFALFSICHKKIFYALVILIICLNTYHTILTNKNWQKAGEIADNFICAVIKLDSIRDLYIINLPDNYNGAYIFRCNFTECMMLKAPSFKQIKIFPIAFQNLNAEKDIISIKESTNNQIKIIAPLTDCYFMRADEKLKNHELLEIKLEKFSRQQIDLKTTSNIKYNLYYFDGKELKQIIHED